MSTQEWLSEKAVIDIAAELLSRRYGGSPELSDAEVLGGSGNALVLRVHTSPSAFLPHRSLVIKYNPMTGHAIDDAAMLREVVAYQFTTSLAEDVRPGPVLLAHDLDRRVLILSDIGEGDTLADALANGHEEERLHLLRSLGISLGQMHAGTAVREDDYQVLLNRILRQHPDYADHQSIRDESLQDSINIGMQILREAGVELPERIELYATEAAKNLRSGKDRAFTPFDLSPDNVIVSNGLHFLDYEWAGFRNVGFDVACVIAGFPQFLFARPISDEEAEVFTNAWMREVKGIWPRFGDDDEVHRLLVYSLVGWALSSVTTMYAGGIEGVVALAQGEMDISYDPKTSLLRPASSKNFTDDELLIRRDLFETFDAVRRFSANCDDPRCVPVVEFGDMVCERVKDK